MVEERNGKRLRDALGLIRGNIFYLKNRGLVVWTDGSIHTHLVYKSTRLWENEPHCYFSLCWGAPLKTRLIRVKVKQMQNMFNDDSLQPLSEAEFAKFILGLKKEEL
jgi:hypothetical protein